LERKDDVIVAYPASQAVSTMLKISSKNSQGSIRLTLEGRLAGAWVKELEQYWRQTTTSERGSLVVDLKGVTFIEEAGKALLAEMWREGAELIATGCCNKSIVEHITGSRSHAQSTQ
jgi:anti-anti-sigma regulatory factor